jgi:hypothetical protein
VPTIQRLIVICEVVRKECLHARQTALSLSLSFISANNLESPANSSGQRNLLPAAEIVASLRLGLFISLILDITFML